jgi:hypothetical protein
LLALKKEIDPGVRYAALGMALFTSGDPQLEAFILQPRGQTSEFGFAPTQNRPARQVRLRNWAGSHRLTNRTGA